MSAFTLWLLYVELSNTVKHTPFKKNNNLSTITTVIPIIKG